MIILVPYHMTVTSVNQGVNNHKTHTSLSFLHDHCVQTCADSGIIWRTEARWNWKHRFHDVEQISVIKRLLRLFNTYAGQNNYFYSVLTVHKYCCPVSIRPPVSCSATPASAEAVSTTVNKIGISVSYGTYKYTCRRKRHFYTGAYYFRGRRVLAGWVIVII